MTNGLNLEEVATSLVGRASGLTMPLVTRDGADLRAAGGPVVRIGV